MPTILTIDGCRVVIYPNDHRPAHVHVIGAENEAVFHLHCPDGPPEVRENYGFSRSEVRAFKRGLQNALEHPCVEWSRIHGEP